MKVLSFPIIKKYKKDYDFKKIEKLINPNKLYKKGKYMCYVGDIYIDEEGNTIIKYIPIKKVGDE